MEARIDIITLAVADLERALAFYRDGLGLESQGIVGTEFVGDDENAAGDLVMFRLEGDLNLSLVSRGRSWRKTRPYRSARRSPVSSASDNSSRPSKTSTLSLPRPKLPAPRSPADPTTGPGESTPGTFATPTDTSGRSSGTPGSPRRRSDLSRLDSTVSSSVHD